MDAQDQAAAIFAKWSKTTEEAKMIVTAELAYARQKTARLREARLAKEAEARANKLQVRANPAASSSRRACASGP